MAKKNENNDNVLLLGIAGLIGAAIASPSVEQKSKLQSFQYHENDFYYFQQSKAEFENYLNAKYEEARRRDRLGAIKVKNEINKYPEASRLLTEVVHMFVKGFYRGACVFSSVILEHILKDKFENKKLVDLINEACQQGIISNSDKAYFHGLRLDRNDFVHTINQEITENDAKIIILITIKLIDKLIA